MASFTVSTTMKVAKHRFFVHVYLLYLVAHLFRPSRKASAEKETTPQNLKQTLLLYSVLSAPINRYRQSGRKPYYQII